MKKIFVDQIKAIVMEKLGNEYTVSVQEVMKNNGTKMTGLVIRETGQNIAPTIYLDVYNGITEDDLSDVADDIIKIYHQHKNNIPQQAVELDKERILARTTIRVVNAKRNAELLSSCPHKLFLDLAITYRIIFDCFAGMIGTCLITNQMIESYDISIDELEAAAQKNAETYRIEPITEIVNKVFGMEELSEGEIPMYVVTNERAEFGASVLACSDALKRITENLDDDIYIIPSSIHEIITIPKSFVFIDDFKDFKEIVPEVNKSELTPDEVLSDSIYLFTRKTGKLEIL